jgi:uncharacterized protein YecA (UPF0149 family)
MSFEEFKSDLDYALAHPESPWARPAPNEFALFEDTIAELGPWHVVAAGDQGFGDDVSAWPGTPESAVNPFRNVGRNDPCPCDSGKKFKKCCLA